jgi:hypothetical protein
MDFGKANLSFHFRVKKTEVLLLLGKCCPYIQRHQKRNKNRELDHNSLSFIAFSSNQANNWNNILAALR